MRIFYGDHLDHDAPIVGMVVIAEDEQAARRVMHEYEADSFTDDPRLDREIWLDPELTHVAFLGEAAADWHWERVVSAEEGAL